MPFMKAVGRCAEENISQLARFTLDRWDLLDDILHVCSIFIIFLSNKLNGIVFFFLIKKN